MKPLAYPRLPSLALLAAASLWTGCLHDGPTKTTEEEVKAPDSYAFLSRFDQKDNVDYGGQVVRDLLIQDIQSYVKSFGAAAHTGEAVTADAIAKYYNHSDADSMDTRTSTTPPPLKTKYAAISTNKKLKDKISGAKVIGMGDKTADQLMTEWFAIIAANSQDTAKVKKAAVYFDSNGVDLSQMINKVLLGSVSYYQATGVYLQNILTKNNDTAEAGKNYTTMEHNWDEAYGYFGAARNYKDFSDAQLSGSAVTDYVKDVNSDGYIDFKSEYNFPFARNAGKRDLIAPELDLSKTIFEALALGRALITAQKGADEIAKQRTIIVEAWEKLIGASVGHYINQVKKGMAKLGTAEGNLTTLGGHWGEMKGYAIALQYNPFKAIGDDKLAELQEKLGNAPVKADAGSDASKEYLAQLDAAAAILKEAYGFTDAQMAAW